MVELSCIFNSQLRQIAGSQGLQLFPEYGTVYSYFIVLTRSGMVRTLENYFRWHGRLVARYATKNYSWFSLKLLSRLFFKLRLLKGLYDEIIFELRLLKGLYHEIIVQISGASVGSQPRSQPLLRSRPHQACRDRERIQI